ncbi:SSI family serine proteinase inhibitor [Streptomyces sp. NPDC006465]|uniref:SSI family serine proteinase inhibitor n=1 Tax=Streptomyces sp. NPDC006465 TaxID=3157174 RepID=UPI0033BC83C6
MTKTLPVLRGVLLVPFLLLLAGAPPARAAPHEERSGNWLRLGVTRGDARSGDTRGVLLFCDPPQGHGRAAEACEQLRSAGGDIGRIPPRSGAVCPMIYAPVTVSAYGAWDGLRVDYTRTFSNSCAMGAETGAVFDLPS